MNYKSIFFATIALVTLFHISSNLNAENISQSGEDFKKAYNEFQEKHKEFGVSQKLQPFAKNAYEKAKNYYAKNDVELGTITMNYAMTLNQFQSNEENIALIREAIEIFEAQEKTPTRKLIQARLEIARALSMNRKTAKKGRREFDNAVELARDTKDELLIATTEKKAGISILSTYYPAKRSVRAGVEYLKAAESKSKMFNEADNANVQFWLGKGYGLLRKNKSSSEHFEKVVAAKSEDKFIHKLAMTSHAFLVQNYSRAGEDALATKHCLAIGMSQPWIEDQEIEPVYIVHPRYPRKMAMQGKEGWVKLSFTVTPNGFAEDVDVIDSMGGGLFERSSKKVIEKWRFAPKFEDGKAVSAVATYTLQFQLGK